MIELEINVAKYHSGMAGWFRMPEALRVKLIEAISASTVELGSGVQRRVPRGATGKLAAAMDLDVKVLRKMVIGKVRFKDLGTKSHGYLATFFESGPKEASVKVRGYVRHHARGDQYGVDANYAPTSKRVRVGAQTVKAYTRANHLKHIPFLSESFSALRSRIESRLEEAAAAAAAETQ